MDSVFGAYSLSIVALGYMAALMFVQLLVSDVLGIARKHTPGTPVEANHADPLFRAARTVGNTSDSIAVFVCALLFCILSGAPADYTAIAAWAYAAARTLYALFYYANMQTLRSTSFGLSLLCLGALILIGALAP